MGTGTHLSVFAGPTVPLPLPPDLTSRLREAVVIDQENRRSGFELTFDAGRSGPASLLDFPVLTGSPLRPGARVSLVITAGGTPSVIADGFVKQVELTSGTGRGGAELAVTCEDPADLLDRQEVIVEHPLDDYPQVLRILAPYAARGIIPTPFPPTIMDPFLPLERIAQQRGTDLQHLRMLAERHGFICHLVPGPAPGMSMFYWGPPVRIGPPQPAITVDQPPYTNVLDAPRFRLDASTPVSVSGRDTDSRTGTDVPIRTTPPLRVPLSAMPLWATNASDTRARLVSESTHSAISTMARAQAEVERGADPVVAEGTLDGGRYRSVLRARGLVGVRGAGWSNDGLWYVRRVEHRIKPGAWTQAFTLARDGWGSTVPAVLP